MGDVSVAQAQTDVLGFDALESFSIAEWRSALAVCSIFTIAGALAATFGRSLGPQPAIVLPAAAAAWSLCDLLTAFFLFAQFWIGGRLAFGLIGGSYLFSGLLSWPYIAAYTGLLGASTPTVGDQQLAPFLYIVWHLTFPVAVVAAYSYDRGERRILERRRVRQAAYGLIIGVTLLAVLVPVAAYLLRSQLPIFIVDGIFQTAYRVVGMPLVIATSAGGCAVMVRRFRKLRGLPLWLTVAMFTSLLDGVLNESSNVRASYAWDVGKIMTLVTASIVMVRMLNAIVRVYAHVSRLIRLGSEQAVSRLHALWQIAMSEGLSEGDHVQMILDVATANIRQGRDAFGIVSHLEHGIVTIDAVAHSGSTAILERAFVQYRIGRKFSLGDDIEALIFANGRTMWWNGTHALNGFLCDAVGLKSIIGTPFHIFGQTSFVRFGLADELSNAPFGEADLAFVELVASGISQRYYQRAQLERMRHQIEHDALTGLYNRTQFNRLGHVAAADGSLCGVVLIDLDGFRGVNERAGQTSGDELLVAIGAALQRVDGRDAIARLGGDEFAVLLRLNRHGESVDSRLQAYEQIFHAPFLTAHGDGKILLSVSASLGAAEFQRWELRFDDTVSRAGVALDFSKERGGHCSTIYGSELGAIVVERSLERDELIAAMEMNAFVLEYQPTFEMNTRTIVGAEALVRWRHSTRGMLLPAAFLASLERAALLGRLTTWVMQQIARDFEGLALPATFRCYFNVPAQVLESDAFLPNLAQLLAANPQLAPHLGLEITESEVMNKVERAIDSLKRVRALGLLVAIDDFGTGYSSLSYLKRLPIDIVKLDKSFIDGLPTDKRDIALAEMFLGLTRQFSFVSVAEGIENESQAQWLLAHGCMIGQGFLLSAPVPLARLIEMLGSAQQPIDARR